MSNDTKVVCHGLHKLGHSPLLCQSRMNAWTLRVSVTMLLAILTMATTSPAFLTFEKKPNHAVEVGFLRSLIMSVIYNPAEASVSRGT